MTSIAHSIYLIDLWGFHRALSIDTLTIPIKFFSLRTENNCNSHHPIWIFRRSREVLCIKLDKQFSFSVEYYFARPMFIIKTLNVCLFPLIVLSSFYAIKIIMYKNSVYKITKKFHFCYIHRVFLRIRKLVSSLLINSKV